MKKTTIEGKILGVEYKSTSYYGNPKYKVFFEDNEGNYFRGETANDSACAYGIRNYQYTEKATITFHYTRNGNLIIDYVK